MSNDRLRDALLRKGITPAALAERLDVSTKSVERWITIGRTPYPRHRHQICTILDSRENYLWPGAVSSDRVAQISESELLHIYARRSALPYELWRGLIANAAHRIEVLVYAGLFLPEQFPNLGDLFKSKASNGAQIRVLLGDPRADAVSRRGNEEGIGEAMGAKVQNVLRFYEKLQGTDNIEFRFHNTPLYNSLYRFDDEMLVNTHLFGYPAAHAPVLHLRRISGGSLFETYEDSFELVWASGTPVWDTQ